MKKEKSLFKKCNFIVVVLTFVFLALTCLGACIMPEADDDSSSGSNNRPPSEGDPPVVTVPIEITVDGEKDDWDSIGALFDSANNNNITGVYAYQDQNKKKLYLMVKGTNLDRTVPGEEYTGTSFFIDIDNNPDTGYGYPVGDSGADYMLEDDVLYIYDPAVPDWPWRELPDKTFKLEVTETCIEVSIDYDRFGMSGPDLMRLSFQRNYIELSPEGYMLDVPVQPIDPDAEPPFRIIVNGDDSEWTDIGSLIDSGNDRNVKGIYTYQYEARNKLYLMVKGTNLDRTVGTEEYVAATFFLDTDNDPATGYHYPSEVDGVEYMLDHGSIFIYDPSIPDWPWRELEGQTYSLSVSEGCVEAAVSYNKLGLTGPAEIKVCFLRNYEELSPVKGLLSLPVEPVEPRPEPIPGFPVFNRIPNAVGMGVDDTGWVNEMNPEYYRQMINASKAAGTRIMTAWVLGWLDRQNVCAKPKYNISGGAPSDMKEGGEDTNPYVYDANHQIIMDIVEENAAWIEFGVHAVSHSHWVGNEELDTEFAKIFQWPKLYGSLPWGIEDNRLKFECWKEIYQDWFPPEDHSFPESMVAPAHGWYYGADGKGALDSTGSVASGFGIKYVNNDLDVSFAAGTKSVIDHGVLIIHRAQGAHYAMKGTPWETDTSEYKFPHYPDNNFGWTETHFPNWFNNEEPMALYLKGINYGRFRYLPKNTAQCSSQWLYKNHALISGINGTYTIDTRGMVDEAYDNNLLNLLVLKTPLEADEHIMEAEIDKGARITGYYEEEAANPANPLETKRYGYLIIGHGENPMGRLSKDVYTLKAKLGSSLMEGYIDQKGTTYQVYSFDYDQEAASCKIKMYGTQEIKVKLPFIPTGAVSDNPKLLIQQAVFDPADGFFKITVKGTDIQGEIGTITIR